jgi:peptidyl-prolyl cis-trans isomerase A (cyclophilin A)
MMRDKLITVAAIAVVLVLLVALNKYSNAGEKYVPNVVPESLDGPSKAKKKPKLEGVENMIAVVETNMGTFSFEFYSDDAPQTVASFIKLAKDGFYDGLIFHRIMDGFMIQGGDPTGTGTGGPGYSIKAEFNDNKHVAGTVAMARSASPDSAGSQFYVCLAPTPHLDGEYTVFGQVVDGLDVVLAIGKVKTGRQDRPLEDVVMEKVTIEEKSAEE